jgi:uncharacterized coiled-coil protein SlyX
VILAVALLILAPAVHPSVPLAAVAKTTPIPDYMIQSTVDALKRDVELLTNRVDLLESELATLKKTTTSDGFALGFRMHDLEKQSEIQEAAAKNMTDKISKLRDDMELGFMDLKFQIGLLRPHR